MKTVLVTGGLGYIGSHTVVRLIENGYNTVVIDNLSNSNVKVLDRIKTITGQTPIFYEYDCCDKENYEKIFKNHKIDHIIHFAGYKAVGESVREPLKYYRNNINSTINTVELMKKYGVKNIIFSSSATVYGNPTRLPFFETDKIGKATNPYGQTKIINELMLKDFAKANPGYKAILLRYFNPIGAHPSGLIGEDPLDIPNNLMPYITQVAVGKLAHLNVYGNDYNTIDGTGVRDYIHVVDLADGHVASIKKFDEDFAYTAYNLGTGRGTSVLELVKAFEDANDLKIPYVIVERRPGDIDSSYANCDKALKELGWASKLTVVDACKHSWNWQKNNPNGYRG